MKYKNYLDEEKEGNFGIITEGENAGKLSYVERSEIKEIEIDDKFVPNEGYNLNTVRQKVIDNIKNDDKFISYLSAFHLIDNWISDETNPRIKALYTLIKKDVLIPYLQDIKKKIINNS